jgi:hypothetical protein
MKPASTMPPSVALWLLRYICRGQSNEALAGDLIERFREGTNRSWFWRQVVIACAWTFFSEMRRRWPLFCYAVVGTVAACLTPIYAPTRVSIWLHWSDLPWPLSQFVFELSTPVILTLASLCVLATGLAVQRTFRPGYLCRTWMISLILIAIMHFSVDLFPWLLRPIPGDPYHKVLIVPETLQVISLLATFILAAWPGFPMWKDRRDGQLPELREGA